MVSLLKETPATAAGYLCLKRVDISILVVGDASGVMGYDGRRSESSDAPIHMK